MEEPKVYLMMDFEEIQNLDYCAGVREKIKIYFTCMERYIFLLEISVGMMKKLHCPL